MAKQDKIEKAIFQILCAFGVISDTELRNHYETIKSDFEHNNQTLLDSIKALNQSLRNMSLEIRSINVKEGDEDEEVLVLYHGLVNIEEDLVAKEFGIGSNYTPEDMKLFSTIIQRLLYVKIMASDEIVALKPRSTSENSVHALLRKLKAQGWLDHNHRSDWIIGKKAYMELRSYFENVINSEGAEGDEEQAEENRLQIQRLPQIIMY